MEKNDEQVVLEHLESLGLSREKLSAKKWEQICAVYITIKKLQQEKENHYRGIKQCTVTVSNVEKALNKYTNTHISHALFFQKKNGGIINEFINSFKPQNNDNSPDLNEKNKIISAKDEQIKKMAKRDHLLCLMENDISILMSALKANGIQIPTLSKKYEQTATNTPNNVSFIMIQPKEEFSS